MISTGMICFPTDCQIVILNGYTWVHTDIAKKYNSGCYRITDIRTHLSIITVPSEIIEILAQMVELQNQGSVERLHNGTGALVLLVFTHRIRCKPGGATKKTTSPTMLIARRTVDTAVVVGRWTR